MSFEGSRSLLSRTALPWFRRSSRLTLVVAVTLFVAIFLLRLFVGRPVDSIAMLFVLPIALLAMTFGLRGGLVAGAVGFLLTMGWVTLDHVDLSLIGWVSRVLPLMLLGALLGDASDRLQRAELRRREADAAVLRHRQAVEINDTLIQGMAAARWSLEAGRSEAGMAMLDDTLRLGHDLVSKLIRDADMGRRVSAPETGRTVDTAEGEGARDASQG